LGALIISNGGAWRYVANGELVGGGDPPPPPPTYKYINLTGANGCGARVTENGSLNLSGSQTMYCLEWCDDWTPAVVKVVATKWADTGNQRSYAWTISDVASFVGSAVFMHSPNGTTLVERYSPVPSPAMTDDAWVWTRRKFTASTNAVEFATAPAGSSPDPTVDPTSLTWTVRATQTPSTAAAAIYASTARFTIGGIDELNYNNYVGRMAQVIVANASDTVVFRADPSNWESGTSWVTSTGHTVTLAGAATIVNL
jgi:hypothetical protein